MKENLVKAIHLATQIDTNTVAKMLTLPKDTAHGDYAFPCFTLSKAWQKNPAECAEKLSLEIKLPNGILKSVPTGPYLNFFLDRPENLKTIVNTINQQKFSYGFDSELKTKNIVIDYSSPNIAKPFHIGHLRATIIGLALHKVYQHLGYHTIAVNHLGDWGTQFGFVYAGVKLFGEPKSESVLELVKLYIEANSIKKLQQTDPNHPDAKKYPDVDQIAKKYFQRLEAGEPEAYAFWKRCNDLSIIYLNELYARLGIKFDHYLGESFYVPFIEEACSRLKASGLMTESKGAWGIELSKELGFARLLTDDNRSLYLTRDIVTAEYREKNYQPEKILYVIGAPQTLHFRQLRAVMAAMQHPSSNKIVHVAFGHVPGISTRNLKDDPESLLMESLLDEAAERALKAYHENVTKRPENVNENEVAEKVGLGAIYFNYLSRTNIKDFHFSWEEALNFQGDTGPYLQYALARLYSIEARAKEAGLVTTVDFDSKLLYDDNTYALAVHLSKFSSILHKITEDYEPNHLAQYCLELAKLISKNYSTLRVLGEENKALAEARLSLFSASRYVLHTGISLLGIPALEKM